MSFRLSTLNFCRAGIMAFACLALVEASRAGEGARSIEIVPLHGTSIDTNFDQSSQADSQMFKSLSPQAPGTLRPAPRMGQAMILPPPPQQQQSTMTPEHEKELLDRRRNWVFMTAEDYASDGKKSKSDAGTPDKNPTTVMQRYYQSLYDSDQPSGTNQFKSEKFSALLGPQTNSMGGDLRPVGSGFGGNAFNSLADQGALQPLRRSDFSNPFGSDATTALRAPEQVRLESEQKARMDSFRQLWNIDQPAPATVAPPTPAPTVDSGPLFGLSAPGVQPAKSAFASEGNSAAAPSSQIAPTPTVDAARSIRPPRADFLPQQRPF